MENDRNKSSGSLYSKSCKPCAENHALEHATVHILEKKFPIKNLPDIPLKEVWIIGKLSIQEIQEAADAAFARLSHGERISLSIRDAEPIW